MSDKIKRDTERWMAAAHAVQTGVAHEHELGSQDGTPKHLRTGVNCAMADHGSLAKLLISKGLITEEEYIAALADGMEEEVKRYEERLTERLGRPVRLL